MNTKYIWVTTSFVGYHCWPDAPEEVMFLRVPHRHVFHVKVHLIVSHNDRALEFFMVQREVVKCLPKNESVLGSMSCEMLAEELRSKMKDLGYKCSMITVSEDGENGATLTWD